MTTSASSTQSNINTQSIVQSLIYRLAPQYLPTDRAQLKREFSFDNLFHSVNFQSQAKDPYGNLHPQYRQSIKKGYDAIKDYIQLYTGDILSGIREIDLLCIKTSDRKMQKYQQCKQVMNNKAHRQVIVPLVNAAALLYRVSNQCLLKGNSVDMCANIVADHTYYTFRLASEKMKTLTVELEAQVPEEGRSFTRQQ